MRVDVEDWKNGWMGVEIGLSRAEIDALIARLQVLKAEPDQHFHISGFTLGWAKSTNS